MSKLYLPEKLVLNQKEEDVRPYKDRENTCFCLALTVNRDDIGIYVGGKEQETRGNCFTAVSWVEDNICIIPVEENDQFYPRYYRIVKTLTFYLDMGGFVQTGNYEETRFYAQRQKRTPTAHFLDTIDKVEGKVERISKKVLPMDFLLHNDVIRDQKIKLENGGVYELNPHSEFYRYLCSVSAFNHTTDMSFVYASAYEAKKLQGKAEAAIGVLTFPVKVSELPVVFALQTSLELISFLIAAKNTLKLDEKMFNYRGPIIISDVYYSPYINKVFFDPNAGKYLWGVPEKNKDYSDDSSSNFSKKMELDKFLLLNTTLAKEIKK